MPNGRIVTIVDSREAVKVSILMNSIKKADFTVEEFVELLKGKTRD